MLATVKSPAIEMTLRSALIDVFALAFVFLMPTFSHVLSFPLYYIEPMRIMVVLAMMHSHRNNAFILALILPLFSFAIAAHPVLIKSMLIAVELMAMVGAFYLLKKQTHTFIAILSAIVLSKLVYYGLKYFAVLWLIPEQSMVGVPFVFQLLATLVISGYVWMIVRRNSKAAL